MSLLDKWNKPKEEPKKDLPKSIPKADKKPRSQTKPKKVPITLPTQIKTDIIYCITKLETQHQRNGKDITPKYMRKVLDRLREYVFTNGNIK